VIPPPSPRSPTSPPPAASRARIAAVDGLRALAFLAVFAFHSWEFSGRPQIPVVADVVGANVRPDFFVVLTGFVLFLPFARDLTRVDGFDARLYLRRRLRRIVPPYYAALLFAVVLPQVLVVMMKALGRDASWQPLPTLADVLSHLTFTHLFFPDFWDGINGSLWTMSLEMQLYLLFPVLLVLFARYGVRTLLWAAVVSVVFSLGVALVVAGPAFPDQFLWKASGLGRLIEFVGGMVAAWAAFSPALRPSRRRLALLVALGAAGAYVSQASWLYPLPTRELGLTVVFAVLIHLTITVARLGRLFAVRPLSSLGYRAYSMFLVHQPVAWYVSEGLKKFAGIEPGPVHLALMWSVGLALVVLVGQVFFVAVERPAIAWAKQVPATRRAVAVRQASTT
jgi:peptidoglycan/LPS O-acetylase OafA/YrhL